MTAAGWWRAYTVDGGSLRVSCMRILTRLINNTRQPIPRGSEAFRSPSFTLTVMDSSQKGCAPAWSDCMSALWTFSSLMRSHASRAEAPERKTRRTAGKPREAHTAMVQYAQHESGMPGEAPPYLYLTGTSSSTSPAAAGCLNDNRSRCRLPATFCDPTRWHLSQATFSPPALPLLC